MKARSLRKLVDDELPVHNDVEIKPQKCYLIAGHCAMKKVLGLFDALATMVSVQITLASAPVHLLRRRARSWLLRHIP